MLHVYVITKLRSLEFHTNCMAPSFICMGLSNWHRLYWIGSQGPCFYYFFISVHYTQTIGTVCVVVGLFYLSCSMLCDDYTSWNRLAWLVWWSNISNLTPGLAIRLHLLAGIQLALSQIIASPKIRVVFRTYSIITRGEATNIALLLLVQYMPFNIFSNSTSTVYSRVHCTWPNS